jgi:hypothetical protein
VKFQLDLEEKHSALLASKQAEIDWMRKEAEQKAIRLEEQSSHLKRNQKQRS